MKSNFLSYAVGPDAIAADKSAGGQIHDTIVEAIGLSKKNSGLPVRFLFNGIPLEVDQHSSAEQGVSDYFDAMDRLSAKRHLEESSIEIPERAEGVMAEIFKFGPPKDLVQVVAPEFDPLVGVCAVFRTRNEGRSKDELGYDMVFGWKTVNPVTKESVYCASVDVVGVSLVEVLKKIASRFN